MLTLEGRIKLDEAAVKASNLCDRFSGEDLDRIGGWCKEGYKRDKQSRSKWERRVEAAMDLAMQIQKTKTFPWPNCSNVAFPLITIGTLQFHARAYPALIDGPDIVQYRVVGEDPAGVEKARADRIGEHMSWQCTEEDESWEEQHDRLLIHLPVVGTAFTKTQFRNSLGHQVSELVLAYDLVVNYWAKSLKGAARKTHLIPLHRNDIWESVQAGTFRPSILTEAWYESGVPPQETDAHTAKTDNREGQNKPAEPDETTPYQFGEQHCLLDLDGDGYAEPYVITFELTSGYVARIVTGFERLEDIERTAGGRILRINRFEPFTQYTFIPSPDGGLYGIGFGILLGPINENVNSLINQMNDAGSMVTAGGGFLGSGAQLKGGIYTFSPFRWNRVNTATGASLKDNIVPLPTREPSVVLFQLLVLLVNYANRITGATDPMVGENPGQNQPAETTRTVVDMGQKIYSAIFKRVRRCMKEEFGKRYVLNAIYLPANGQPFGPGGKKVTRQDYMGDPTRVAPVADPNVLSDGSRLQQALTLREMSRSSMGYDWDAVERRVLRAMKVQGVEELYVGAKDPRATQPPNPKAAIEQLKTQREQMKLQAAKEQYVLDLMEERRVNNAKILQLEAQAMKLVAEAQGVEAGHKIAAFEAQVGALKLHSDHLNKQIELALKGLEMQHEQGAGNEGAMGGMAGARGNQGLPGQVPAGTGIPQGALG